MKTTPTTILDACCGGRMFHFNKDHPNILYVDRRRGDCFFVKGVENDN